MITTQTPNSISILVVCNAYPSKHKPYRNGFVHRRIKGYTSVGFNVEVFYHHEPTVVPYTYSYDGIPVVVGNEASLEKHLQERRYDIFLVHFPEPARVRPLGKYQPQAPIICWIHGFEAEAWHRRWFNFIHSSELIREALAKKRVYHEPQTRYLAGLVDSGMDITFVNVSKWFRHNVVEPDIKRELPGSQVIPNFIDPEVFPYRPKGSEHRKKILSIRPFASRKYANDLSINAVLELSKRPFFNDLQFTFYGEGDLFTQLTEPLHQFQNVTVKNELLQQHEIANIHRQFGVFLCPSRFDSQGVSMCEAMSSGLVPISTRIAAIPEFVEDGQSGLLTSPESSLQIADAIESLYFDEESFLRLSAQASQRSQNQCGFDATIRREIDLILNKVSMK